MSVGCRRVSDASLWWWWWRSRRRRGTRSLADPADALFRLRSAGGTRGGGAGIWYVADADDALFHLLIRLMAVRPFVPDRRSSALPSTDT